MLPRLVSPIVRIAAMIAVAALAALIVLPQPAALASELSQASTPVTATPTDTLRLRSGPGTGYSVIGRVPAGKPLVVIGRNEAATWLLVQDGGRQGWVAAWYCTLQGDLMGVPVTNGNPINGLAAVNGIQAVTGDALRLRAGPGTSFPVVGRVGRGRALPVLGVSSDGSWLYVEAGGTRGWVARWYCTLSGDLAGVPMVNADGSPATATPAPAPSAVAGSVAMPPIVPRAAWGAREIVGGYTPHTPDRVTIHMDGAYFEHDPIARMQLLQSWSIDTVGWVDIPYHYVIDRQGTIYEGRPVQYVGDTHTDYDPTGHVSIAVMGDYDQQGPTRASIQAVIDLAAWLSVTYNIPPDRILGHRDYAYTSCPGEYFYFDYVANGFIRREVEAKLRGGS